MLLRMEQTAGSADGTRGRLRERSKRVLGNADRLEVAAAVARASGLVHAQGLANEVGITPPRVRAQLVAFTEAGLMELVPRTGQIVYYNRLDDPFWDAARALHAAWS
jgi:DNA-binding transcriptional ArsR family regulator